MKKHCPIKIDANNKLIYFLQEEIMSIPLWKMAKLLFVCFVVIKLYLKVFIGSNVVVRNKTERSQVSFSQFPNGNILKNCNTTQLYYQHWYSQDAEHPSPQGSLLLSFYCHILFPPTPIPPTHWSYISIILSFQESNINGIIQHVTFWGLAFFHSTEFLKIHAKCCVYQQFVPFCC